MKVMASKSSAFYARAAGKLLLEGTPEKVDDEKKEVRWGRELKTLASFKLAQKPLEAIRVSGLGQACSVAIAAAAQVEKQGIGVISKVQTAYPSLSGKGCPQILIDLKRVGGGR